MFFKLPIFLFLLSAVPLLAEFSDGDSDVLYQINQHVIQMRNVQAISNGRLDSILSRLTYIQDYAQSISEYSYSMNTDIHSISTDIHSISSVVESISYTLPSITNILIEQGASITNALGDIIVSLTNSIPCCYDLSIVTNFLLATGFVANKGLNENQLLDYALQHGFYTAFNLNPFYWASSGLIMPVRTSTVANEKAYIDKLKSNVPNWTIFSGSLSAGRSIIEQYMPPAPDNSYDYLDFMTRSELARETLYGTYDIEEILKSFTNQVSSSILNSYSQSSFNNQLSYATNLLRGSSSEFSTSVSSPTNATIFSTEDSSWSSAMSSSEFTPDDSQFVASFQDGFNQFVATWQNGIQVGSPTLVVHFAGVDGQLENTFSLDYTISNEARNKVRSIWRVIFTLIRASLYFWGYMTLLRAVLNNYADTMRHNDFLEGADVD